jgi:hypothetical protein
MASFDELNKKINKMEKENNELISNFEMWLVSKKITDKTIKKHMFNVDFFINCYLLHYLLIGPKDGISEISGYFGYWFIRKAMWASEVQIKNNATSIRKFYGYLNEVELISNEELDLINMTIKDNITEWIELLKEFDERNEKDFL